MLYVVYWGCITWYAGSSANSGGLPEVNKIHMARRGVLAEPPKLPDPLQCGAPKIAFSWFITPITMVYDIYL